MKNTKQNSIYNCHTHIFHIDHVPNDFSKAMMSRIFSKILTIKVVKWYYLNFTERGSDSTKRKFYKRFLHTKRKIYFFIAKLMKFTFILWWVYRSIVFFLKWFMKILLNILRIEIIISPKIRRLIDRYLILARYSAKYKNQASLFNFLRKNYPPDTKFVTLSMDMEYMNAGKPKISYLDQIEELKRIKARQTNLYPFIHIDPRRIEETSDEKGKKNFASYAQSLLHREIFNGIKIYPALGYYPFDERLTETFKFAQELDIPVLTHCNRGSVFYRGKKKKEWNRHPILQFTNTRGDKEFIPLPQTKNYDFTGNFTHPLNYHCLLNKDILSEYLGREEDLSKLKICFGHFGGSDEWDLYKEDVWNNYNNNIAPVSREVYFERKNTLNHGSKRTVWWNASWLSVIYDLMVNYENVYADVSFLLYYKHEFPLLKYLLHDEKVKDKILFGTDYYVVSHKQTDKSLYQELRSYLGEDLFMKIAHFNAEKYLTTDI